MITKNERTTKMKKIFIISCMLIFLSSILNAETMSLVVNGVVHEYELSDISSIDFTNFSVDDYEELFSKIPIELMQNYPNPFKPQSAHTTISFDLKKTGLTDVSIYNVKGQKVKTLSKEDMQIGTHSILWDGKDNDGKTVASGVYLYSVTQDDNRITKKMIIIK